MNSRCFQGGLPPLIMGLVCMALLIGCSDPEGHQVSQGDGAPVFDETYLDPTGPNYMTGPVQIHYSGPENMHLEDREFRELKSQLQGFLESNNESEFERHFRDFYIPETFPTDSLLELYVRMYFQWDSIGVSNRFDNWWVRYVSPFAPGEVYDVAIAEIHMRHHQVFQKRWTGNYRNFGRTMSQRYPGATIEYMDTTYVDANGDTALHRLISADVDRMIYFLRGHESDSLHDARIRLLNDGWQLSPQMTELMDSAAVAFVEDHQRQFGTLQERPLVSGR
mgnify:FL=1